MPKAIWKNDGQIGAEATMLDIDGDGNLGIVHRGKGDKGRVVFARILDGARLAADGIGGLDAGGRALFYGKAQWVKGRFSDPFPSLLGLLIRKQSQILFDDILL